MKHIRIICLLVLLAGMSSCGMMHQTTSNRTARSFEIQTDIQQMPTVADLVVDTVYVRQDTTWTNKAFKSFTSKSDIRTLLLGAMLEKAKADVIIQPRENFQASDQKHGAQVMRMEIYGYPARYRNFRTATEEDLRILEGLDPKPVNYNTIYIGGGYQQGPVQGLGGAARAITPAPTELKQPKKPAYVRNAYYTSLELGYNYMGFFNMMEGGHGFLADLNFLWKAKNPHIHHGIGLGLNTVFGKYDDDNDAREWYIPMYYHARFYWGLRRVIPFFDFRFGGFMGVFESNHNNNWKDKESEFGGGMYYAAFLGLEFGKHINFSVGTDQFFGGIAGAEGILFNLNLVGKMGINF